MIGNRTLIFLVCGAISLTMVSGCGHPAAEATHSFFGSTMGTQYTVRVADRPENLDLAGLKQDVERTLARVNSQMSTYQPDSELSRFNRYQGNEWFAVSVETALVVAAGQAVSRVTDGAFDVTVGPLVNLWGFGPTGRPDRIPTDEAIAESRARVGYELLEVRHDPPALRKLRADLYVDLSAIAKGFGVDEISRLLEQQGVRSYMVEIGGDVRTRGRKPDGSPWLIGIERPAAGVRMLQCVVELEDRALATSGDYRNFFELDGQRYSHGIDPRSGRPLDHALVSVSVLAEDCTTADAWATALLVLGPDAALSTAQREGLEVLFILRTPEGFVEQTTPGFMAHVRTLEPRTTTPAS